MKDSDAELPEPKPTPLGKLKTFARKLLPLPTAAADKWETDFQRQQARKPERGPKPVRKR